MRVNITNTTIFTVDVNCKWHWSKLPKFIKFMKENFLNFKRGAYLRGADLRGAYLRGAYLRGADLRGADLEGADLRGADLEGAYLRGADLRGAYLRGAYLRGAYLGGAYLRGADLRGAYLRGAYLRGADLEGAYLRGADLRGAYLRGADLRERTKSTPEKIKILDFMTVAGLGSQNRQTIFYLTEIGIIVQCGCFYGTEEAFKKAVKETHKDGQFAKEYLTMLKVVKVRFNRNKECEDE